VTGARRLAVRAVLVVGLACAGTLVGVPVALAHAVLESTDPVDGAVLAVAPATVSLVFSEPVAPVASGTSLIDDGGATVSTTTSVRDRTVLVALPDQLADGTYVLSWRVISVDGHPVSGASTFVVGEAGASDRTVSPSSPAPGAAPAGAGEGAVATAVRDGAQGLAYAGAFALVGLVVLELFLLVDDSATVGRTARRLSHLARGAAAVAVLGILVAVPATWWWQGGGRAGSWPGWLAAAASAPTASGDVVRAGAALLGILLLLLVPRGTALRRMLAVAGAVLLLGSFVASGHSRSAAPAALVLTADAMHVAAGAVWFGGLVGLGAVLGLRHGPPVAQAVRTLGRFSLLAGGLLATVGVTGVLLGWRILGSWDALATTGYGRTLLIKVTLAGAVTLIAAWNRLRLVPRFHEGESEHAPRATLRRTVASEAVLLALLLLVTGVLVSLAPERAASSRSSTPSVTSTAPADLAVGGSTGPVTVPLGDGFLRLDLEHAAAGDVLTLATLDPAGAVVEPLSSPSVELTLPGVGIGPLRPRVSRSAPGTYTGSVALPVAGRWRLEATVRTSRYDSPVAVATIDVP